MSDETEDLITQGSYVVIRKQKYKKLYKVTGNGHVNLGKLDVEMREIIGKRFWSSFEIISGKNGKQTLRQVSEAESWDDLLNELPSGNDNRTIIDDGTSQKLSKEEILQLQESGMSGKAIVGSLIENSKSFLDKTGYSQEKYLKKKKQKYSNYITILKPDIRMLHDIYFKLDSHCIGGLRMDALAQLLCYSDVQAEGLFLLYDSGSKGLPAAAMLNRIGANTDGRLIHMHPGNSPQTTIVDGMNFPKEQLDRLLNVNIYSFFRLYYQGEEAVLEHMDKERELKAKKSEKPRKRVKKEESTTPVKEENNETTETRQSESSQVTPQIEVSQESEKEVNSIEAIKLNVEEDTNPLKRKLEELPPPKRPRWFYETKKAVELAQKEKAKGLVIVAKEHPLNIVKELIPFLGVSRPFVIFHQHREVLQETYMALKQDYSVVNLRLFTNFLRAYQVLPDRTHPEILTNDTGGYLLTGYLVE